MSSQKPALPRTLIRPPSLRVENITKFYPVGKSLFGSSKSFVHAVENVSLEIAKGGSFGIVGESGCGKTTLAKMLVKLIEPTAGRISVDLGDGQFTDCTTLGHQDTKEFRRKVQMIFQDPYESLNPRITIFDTIIEPLKVQKIGNLSERKVKVTKIMAEVGLTPVNDLMFRYPHELSGGQRQRVAIARALILDPIFLIADEPTSMLDVSVRTSIMKLMLDMRQRLNATFIYITHDMAVARYMCESIAVMYLGKIVEMGSTEDILQNPKHPYTKALISAVPVPDPTYERWPVLIKSGVAKPIDPLDRCRFFDRCLEATEHCENFSHPILENKAGGRAVACYEVS
ncbi:MAG: ABC transporter ATP-binding protein [Chloroflexi bacterium]|nr:ABC transporter ATP-binding protein [Chloroflexota bacterium]